MGERRLVNFLLNALGNRGGMRQGYPRQCDDKLFPAEAAGPAVLKAMRAVLPQGTRVRVNGDGAAGTPHAFSASPAFVAALEAIDARNGAVDADGEEVHRLIAESRQQDAISLLVLLRDYPQLAEGPMFERLAILLPTPLATRDAWRSDRMAVLNAWWDALPYPRVKRWWTQWPDALPSRSAKMAQWLATQGNG